MKRLLKISVLVLLVGYLITSFVLWGNEDKKVVCQHFYIHITDSAECKHIDREALYDYIEQAQLLPVGKSCGEISVSRIEQHVSHINLLKDVECYYENNGDTHLFVSQRRPIMRVYDAENKTYYVDINGESVAVDTMYLVQVPLVSGYLDDKIEAKDLIPLVQYVSSHPFWSIQVSQIYVTEQQDVVLYPRVGEHVILLGDVADYAPKLNSVLALYNQVMPRMGWAEYDTISVKYKDQVVCTRKNKRYNHNVSSK